MPRPLTLFPDDDDLGSEPIDDPIWRARISMLTTYLTAFPDRTTEQLKDWARSRGWPCGWLLNCLAAAEGEFVAYANPALGVDYLVAWVRGSERAEGIWRVVDGDAGDGA